MSRQVAIKNTNPYEQSEYALDSASLLSEQKFVNSWQKASGASTNQILKSYVNIPL
ncbi:hypothetical protein Fluta_2210 [Fluviicola taffensis DSM 16823]|uniref:Uncharacterized protein n=1 Tax=Fluviicola taffensis (strain DSM 16823 / NCIMB 13979 / RW262) TaxID=755732 RepID=F2IAP1_FLUTR|nr:hypothetical protein Fluta_2210 [Fluviicola taffensis DSM 16823]